MTTPPALAAGAALVVDDPVAAFEHLLAAWRLAPWPRLGDLVQRVAARAESTAAHDLRDHARRGRLPQELWLTAEATLPGADRGALLSDLANVTAKEAAVRLARVAAWGPDPRVSDALHGLLERRPWKYSAARPVWTAVSRLLTSINDHRLLRAPWLDLPAMQAHLAEVPGAWLTERILKTAQRVAAGPPPPPMTAEAEELLDAIEAALPATEQPALPSVPDAPGTAASLPATLDRRRSHVFDADIVPKEVRAAGPRTVVSLQQRRALPATVVFDADGTVSWARSAAGVTAVSPDGGLLAQVTVTGNDRRPVRTGLTIVRIADGAILSRRSLDEHVDLPGRVGDLLPEVRWEFGTIVVVRFVHRHVLNRPGREDLLVIDTATGVLWTTAVKDARSSGFAVDGRLGVLARHSNGALFAHDLRSGRLLQAWTIGDGQPWSTAAMSGLCAAGAGRLALICVNGSAAGPGSRGSFVSVVEAATGWCLDESPAIPGATLAVLPDDRPAQLVHDRQAQAVRVTPVGSAKPVAVPVGAADFWGWSGTGVVASGKDRIIRFFDPLGAAPVRQLPVLLPTVRHLAVSDDGTVIAAAAAGPGAMIWTGAAKPTRVSGGTVQAGVTGLAISAAGHTAVAVHSRAEVRGRDGRKAGALKVERTSFTGLAGCRSHNRFAAATHDGRVVLYDDAHLPLAEERCPGADGGGLTTLTWSPSGRLLAGATTAGRVLVVDASGTPVWSADAGVGVRGAWFPPGEDRLLLWTDDDRLGWLSPDGGPPRPWREAPGVTGVALHPTHGWLALGHDDGRVSLHTNTGDRDAELPVGRHFGPVTALAFAADLLVVGAGRPGRPSSLTAYGWPMEETR